MEHFKTVCMLMFDYKIIQVYGWCHVFKEDIFKELFARAVEEPVDSFQVVHPRPANDDSRPQRWIIDRNMAPSSAHRSENRWCISETRDFLVRRPNE